MSGIGIETTFCPIYRSRIIKFKSEPEVTSHTLKHHYLKKRLFNDKRINNLLQFGLSQSTLKHAREAHDHSLVEALDY